MIFVVDANILFAALLKDGTTRAIMLFSDNKFYAPDYSIQEFKKHLPRLQKITGLTQEEMLEVFYKVVEATDITFVPFEDFKAQKDLAEKISPDPDDVLYLALALHLNCFLWSNDGPLKDQNKVKVVTTKELLEILRNNI